MLTASHEDNIKNIILNSLQAQRIEGVIFLCDKPIPSIATIIAKSEDIDTCLQNVV